MTIKSLCAYCGSSSGQQQQYRQAALELADIMVDQGIQLIYGGASIGLMGTVADRVLAGGGHVIGVIPQALAQQEVAHHGLSQLHITHSMHERKMKMAELADGFIALPGGIGTLEELFEIWTWSQLAFHHKPIGLLNAGAYYDLLLAFLDHMQQEQFFKREHRALLLTNTQPSALIEHMMAYHDRISQQSWSDKTDLC